MIYFIFNSQVFLKSNYFFSTSVVNKGETLSPINSRGIGVKKVESFVQLKYLEYKPCSGKRNCCSGNDCRC